METLGKFIEQEWNPASDAKPIWNPGTEEGRSKRRSLLARFQGNLLNETLIFLAGIGIGYAIGMLGIGARRRR